MKKRKADNGYQKSFGLSDPIVWGYHGIELYGIISNIRKLSSEKFCISILTHGNIIPESYPASADIEADSLFPSDALYYPEAGRYYIGQPVTAVAQEFDGEKADCIIEEVSTGFLNFGRNKYKYKVYCVDEKFYGKTATVSYDRISFTKVF